MRKTNIIATIGPTSYSESVLEQMLVSGMDIARLNFSHGTYEEYSSAIKNIRALSEKLKKPAAIIQDLGGPRMRIGDFEGGTIELEPGETFTLTTENIVGNKTAVSVSDPRFPSIVSAGTLILLDDGKRKLEVVSKDEKSVQCVVKEGGEIIGQRGINIKGANLALECLTEKDMRDLEFGMEREVDFVALSFVRSADDVKKLRDILAAKKSRAAIISKIETAEAVEKIDEIIGVSDAIMIARGDLAIQVSAEEVPLIQKTIIKKAIEKGKPVITATHMLDSMIRTSVPTRAEVNDVANAILDGSDAIMLSAETAIGKYPVPAVETMARIAEKTEASPIFAEEVARFHHVSSGVADSVSAAVVETAKNIGAKYIVAISGHGTTPRMISRYKPAQPIIVLTADKAVEMQLLLSYGCIPAVIKKPKNLDDAIETARKMLKEISMAEGGDAFVLSAGIPLGDTTGTNLLLVQNV